MLRLLRCCFSNVSILNLPLLLLPLESVFGDGKDEETLDLDAGVIHSDITMPLIVNLLAAYPDGLQ